MRRFSELPENPTVSVIITVYNLQRYIAGAIDSVLNGDWPHDRLEIIAVDDCSTDGCAEILRSYGDRIRYIRHEVNKGVAEATNTGVAAATGDLIALLDGDDLWTPDHLTLMVALMQRNPSLGLVHGDLTVIDSDGRQLSPSWFDVNGHHNFPRGYIFGTLLHHNVAGCSAQLFRSELVDHIFPILPVSSCHDWYIAAHAAQVSEIDHVDKVVFHYRQHANNITLGASGEKFALGTAKDADYSRWMVANLDVSDVDTKDLVAAVARVRELAAQAAAACGRLPTDMLIVTDEQRALAREQVGRIRDSGVCGGDRKLDEAIRLAVVALENDPWNGEANAYLGYLCDEQTMRARQAQRGTHAGVAAPQAEPQIKQEAVLPPRFAVLLNAQDLIAEPELLWAWCERFTAAEPLTLVIGVPAAVAEDLIPAVAQLVDRHCPQDDAGADVLLTVLPEDQSSADDYVAQLGGVAAPGGLSVLGLADLEEFHAGVASLGGLDPAVGPEKISC